MYLVTTCLLCSSDDVVFETTYLAQFIISRIRQKHIDKNIPIASIRCNRCKFYASSIRFDDDEMFLIYNDYRGYDYNQLRLQIDHSYYGSYIGTFTTDKAIDQRLVGINNIIQRSINVNNIKTVLDYGGESGHFIPKVFSNAEKFVHDISGANLCPGIKRFQIDRQIELDYIQCCHVLEHVSDPVLFMRDLIKLAHTETLIYIEVPNNDGPYPGGVWHEHINTFVEESLEFLCKKVNLTVTDRHTLNGCIGFLTKKAVT